MNKITKIFFLIIIISSCGKKSDIIRDHFENKDKPAKIDNERIYQL